MLIGELASRTGVSIHTIRYYEKSGFYTSVQRKDNNYREYSEDTIQIVLFVKNVQKLGFSLEEIKEVVDVFQNRSMQKDELVNKKINKKLSEVEQKIFELTQIKKVLIKILEVCKTNKHKEKDLKYLLDGLKLLDKV
ncbi:MAG: MerR family transcriptional regulator [Leptospiraceae bacterium]|nr:MerR family transcriptional regulator [Leptospiraceae bacterium]